MSTKYWFVYCVAFVIAITGSLFFAKKMYKSSSVNLKNKIQNNSTSSTNVGFLSNKVVEKTETDLLAEKKIKELETEMKSKFETLMPAMQKVMSKSGAPSNNEEINNSYRKIMRLMMGSSQLMQAGKMSGAKYQLRCLEIVRDMINEAYEEGKNIGLITEKEGDRA